MQEMYRIESVGPRSEGGVVIRRQMIRVGSLESAKAEAGRIFALARRPHAARPQVEKVRVLNGAGYELFSLSVDD